MPQNHDLENQNYQEPHQRSKSRSFAPILLLKNLINDNLAGTNELCAKAQACVWGFLSLDQWKPLIRSEALRRSQLELKAGAVLTRRAGATVLDSAAASCPRASELPNGLQPWWCTPHFGPAMFLLFALLCALGGLHARLGKTAKPGLPSFCLKAGLGSARRAI